MTAATVRSLWEEEQRLRNDLASSARELASRLPTQVPRAAASIRDLACEAAVLAGLEAGVDALVQLTLLARDVDASLSEATSCATLDERLRHYAAAVDTAQTACAAVRPVLQRVGDRPVPDLCSPSQAAVLLHPSAVAPQRLQQAASTRLAALVAGLRQALSAEMDAVLQSSSWPPPLPPISSSSHAPEAPAAWKPASDAFARVATLLDAVRIASSRAVALPHPGDVPPSAWSALRMAAPLCERLRFHFTSGGPVDRRDRPEWLLLHTLRMGAAYAPAVAACLPPPPAGTWQLSHAAALTVALAEEAAAVLRTHMLPAMNADGSGAAARSAWLHLADEMRDFDAKLALTVSDSAARLCGASRVLVEKAEWERHWTRAELDAALRQLDGAVDASDAWHDAVPADDMAEGVEHSGQRPSGVRPVCAVRAMAIIQAVCARATVLPHASQQRAFMRDVPAAVATDLLGRVQRHEKGAAAFGDPAAPDSITRAATCICAARVLHLGLEALAEEPSLWELEQQHAARTRVGGKDQATDGSPTGGVFAAEVGQAVQLLGQWQQALAEALVSQFMVDAAHLLPGVHAGVDAAAMLAPAVLGLGGRMSQLKGLLDAALFASTWCVLAARVVSMCFNLPSLTLLFLCPGELWWRA
jgi:hypothetical protein